MALIVAVDHPEHLYGMLRVDHPTLDPLTQGAADLGWEGDPRLVVYLHKPAQTFVLWRLEASGEYLPVGQFGIGEDITPASVNATIRRLIEVDSRRGFDPYTDVITTNAAQERSAERSYQDALEQFADKFMFGLSRSHLPGVDITRVRNAPSQR